MSRTSLTIITILVLGAASAAAETFHQSPYLAEAGVNVLSRNVANEQFGKNLFGDPYATVVVGNVDVYDRFPYIEARYFQIVSDPAWNRLLMGEVGRGLVAFDGAQSPFGRLAGPHGLASDGRGRLYVADTDNNRVLVFRAVSEFDRMELQPLYAVEGLSKPFAVAVSDGGTPLVAGDDALFVANTGRNEVRRYALSDNGARLTFAIGELGSGDGRFAGPMAIAVGRRDGASSAEVFVSDTHNARIVRLRDTGSSLAWNGSTAHTLGLITSLDTDHWGNVYAAAPQAGRVTKFTASLYPVATFAGDIKRPRSFHVVFANVSDHRAGTETRAGQGTGVLVEEWGGQSGLRLVNLGVELTDAAVVGNDVLDVTLTDHAAVSAEIVDPRSGAVVAHHEAGVLGAGRQTIRFAPADYVSAYSAGEYRVTLRARSTYDQSTLSEVQVPITMNGSGGPAYANRFALLGNTPNPFNPVTTIRFTVPAGPSRPYSLRVYDVQGRLVRELASGQIGGGMHEVRWDGRDARGEASSSGIYLYRLQVGQEQLTGKMALLK